MTDNNSASATGIPYVWFWIVGGVLIVFGLAFFVLTNRPSGISMLAIPGLLVVAVGAAEKVLRSRRS